MWHGQQFWLKLNCLRLFSLKALRLDSWAQSLYVTGPLSIGCIWPYFWFQGYTYSPLIPTWVKWTAFKVLEIAHKLTPLFERRICIDSRTVLFMLPLCCFLKPPLRHGHLSWYAVYVWKCNDIGFKLRQFSICVMGKPFYLKRFG